MTFIFNSWLDALSVELFDMIITFLPIKNRCECRLVAKFMNEKIHSKLWVDIDISSSLQNIIKTDSSDALQWLWSMNVLQAYHITSKWCEDVYTQGCMCITHWLSSKHLAHTRYSFNYKRTIIFKVIRGGHLSMLQWLLNVFGIKKFNVDAHNYLRTAFYNTNEHFHIAEWVVNSFPFLQDNQQFKPEFPIHMRKSVVKWFLKTFNMDVQEFYKNENMALMYACICGTLEDVQWLTTTYYTSLSYQEWWSLFNRICDHNTRTVSQLSILEWIIEMVPLHRDEEYQMHLYVFYKLCYRSNLNIAKWFIFQFNINKQDVCAENYRSLREVCIKDDDDDDMSEPINFATWLIQTFELTHNELVQSMNEPKLTYYASRPLWTTSHFYEWDPEDWHIHPLMTVWLNNYISSITLM